MKFLAMFVATLAAAGGSAAAFASESYTGCANCSAVVTIRSAEAARLVAHVRIISSMPLGGRVLSRNNKSGWSRVEIGTYPEYARAQGINSFDVAKRIHGTLTNGGRNWEIQSIEAAVHYRVPSRAASHASPSALNAGSIGHKR